MGQNISLLGYKILTVDDFLPLLEKTCTILQEYGAICEGVPSGEKAIEICQKESFNLILINIKMPGIDGFETTKAIKSLAKYLQTSPPIIAYTGYSYKDVEKGIKSSGMDGYIRKGGSFESFAKTALTVLSMQ